MRKVAILMGSDSDLPIVEKGIAVLKEYGIPHEVHIYSAHRTPLETAEFVSSAYDNGFGVIIAAAGMEGALPSVVAGLVKTPVIALPTSVGYGANLQGLTPMMAMLNSCASGVTVVNIDNGFGAACAAARIVNCKY